MSKQDNVHDFLTDIAEAIRKKKGTTEPINAQNFSEEIRGIESGGGIVPCEFKDVNFYDYEGTILYSYTWDEFVAKNEMPPLPTHHEHLICQEWNYTLEEVLEQGGRCDVGAIYDTEDGATHIKIVQFGNVQYTICLQTSEIGGAEIHWGDGNVTVSTSTELTYYSHIYTNAGKYDISVVTKKGTISNFGVINTLKTYQYIEEVNVGKDLDSLILEAFRYTTIQKISIPESLYISERFIYFEYYGSRLLGIEHLNIPRVLRGSTRQICEGARRLKTVSVPNTFTTANQYMFSDAPSLQYIHIPSNMSLQSIGRASSLVSITSSKKNTSVITEGNVFVSGNVLSAGGNSANIPSGVTHIAPNAFAYKEQLREIDIPEGVVNIGDAAFNYCTGLTRINIPNGVTTIEKDSFGRLYSHISPIQIPSTVSKLNRFCFTETVNLPYFDFRQHTSVPTLAETTAFSNRGSWKIVVPDNLYDEWINATNWSTYADRIVKASEYIEPTNN